MASSVRKSMQGSVAWYALLKLEYALNSVQIMIIWNSNEKCHNDNS